MRALLRIIVIFILAATMHAATATSTTSGVCSGCTTRTCSVSAVQYDAIAVTIVIRGNTATVSGVADNTSQAFTLAGAATDGSPQMVKVYYLKESAGSVSSVTATISPGADFGIGCVVYHPDSGNKFDFDDAAAGNTSQTVGQFTVYCPTATSSGADDVGMCGTTGAQLASGSGGWTAVAMSVFYFSGYIYKTAVGSGSIQPEYQNSNSSSNARGVILLLKQISAGGGPPPPTCAQSMALMGVGCK